MATLSHVNLHSLMSYAPGRAIQDEVHLVKPGEWRKFDHTARAGSVRSNMPIIPDYNNNRFCITKDSPLTDANGFVRVILSYRIYS